ncbi:MAG: PAS domain S-box protein [Chthoniobacterales bacterium]|nr:PAS domain S-box protein [Chthoniobacterales bacterium]
MNRTVTHSPAAANFNVDIAEERALPPLLAALPAFGSAFAISVGALVLVGWTLDLELLKRIVPAFVAMNPATAVFFILAGLALALSREHKNYPAIAKALGSAILVVGTLKLIGVASDFHPGVDQLLFASKLGSPGDPLPNRMAPNTALSFVLLGLALLSLDLTVKRFSFSQAFALMAGFCALLSVTGYAYGVKSFYGLASFIPMALHTAVTFLVLSAGVFFARTSTPLAQMFATDEAHGTLARRLFPLVVMVTLFLGWLRLKGEERGLYEPRFGTALFAITLCVLFILLVRWTIATIGKMEMDRAATNRQLLQSKLELEESLRQTELILNHARELICTLDAGGRLLTVSASCEPLLGFGASALLGRPFSDLLSGDDRQVAEAAMRQIRAGLSAGNFTTRCERRDGSLTSIDWSVQSSQHSQKIYCVGRQTTAFTDQSPWGAAS